MSATFSHAWAIPAMIAAAIALAVLGLALVMTRRRRRAWQTARLILPGLAALAAALAIASPVLLHRARAANTVILLDLSGSTRISPWRDPAWVRRLAQRRLAPGATVTVLGFAGRPQLLLDHVAIDDPPRWPSAWPPIDPDNRSDLPAALAWRSPSEARRDQPPDPRWLITDGLAPIPPGSEKFPLALTELAPPPTNPDVAVTNLLRLPNGALSIQLRSTGPATALLSVERNHQPLAHQLVAFNAPNGSSRWLTLQDPDPPASSAPQRYDVTLRRTPAPDPWPENDHASLLWTPASQTRVIIVSNTAPSISPVLAPFQTAVIFPSAFPSDVASLLDGNWQVVLLDDIPLVSESPAATLSPQQLAALDQFVRATAGGLLIRGASHAFGPGHYDDSPNPLADLSPVFSSPPSPDRPRARIVFLLDASGSMNESAGAGEMGGGGDDQKFRLASDGLLGALDQLHANDQLTILTFNSAAQRIATGTKAALLPALPALLARVQPTGSTAPDTALPEIAAAFAGKPPDEPALVILLTDGEIPSMDAARWRSLLRATGATLTIVAPPPVASSAPNSLAALAGDVHAQWLATQDATQWPPLLRRALAERFAGRARTTPRAWHSITLDPPLEGTTTRWTQVWRKPEVLLLAAADTTTLAAIAQRGLGKVAALAMENDPSPLLVPILRQLAPPPGDRRFTLAATRDHDAWTLTADAIDAGQFLNGLDLRARLLSSDGTTPAEIAFHPTGPGTYAARVESPNPLAAVILQRGPTADHVVGRLQIPRLEIFEWPASVEPSDRPANPMHATILPPDQSASPPWSPRVAGWQWPLAPACWLLAMALWMTSILVRRSG